MSNYNLSTEAGQHHSTLAKDGIATNCTLVFSTNQGLLAAKAGASLISPFVGRLDDINEDGMTVVRQLVEIFSRHDMPAQVLAASIRGPLHVTQAALAGAHIATIPFKVLQQMAHHPLTDKGIVQFRDGLGEGADCTQMKLVSASFPSCRKHPA